jgi:excisionase family DNA binding protein
MDLSIKEVAQILDVSERAVRNFVSAGKLPVKRKGRQLLVPEEALQIYLQARSSDGGKASSIHLSHAAASPSHSALEPILLRLAGVEGKLEQVLAENQLLLREIQQKQQELAQKDLELEKLQRDLVYQKLLFEKELSDQQRFFDEKWQMMQAEFAQRMELERKHLDEKWMLERNSWSEKLSAQEKRHTQILVEAKNPEGFWSRLVKMMTWE